MVTPRASRWGTAGLVVLLLAFTSVGVASAAGGGGVTASAWPPTLTNTSFEQWATSTDPNVWQQSATGITRWSTQRHSGSYAVRIDQDKEVWQDAAATPGKYYMFWFWGRDGDFPEATIQFYNAADVQIDSTQGYWDAAYEYPMYPQGVNGWARFGIGHTAPAGTTHIQVHISSWGGSGVFDDASLEVQERVGYTNPIAYDIASLLKTRFYIAMQTGGTAKLRVKTPMGDKVLFNGTMSASDSGWKHFYEWDGKMNGQRLPSAAYDWDCVMVDGGVAKTISGKITISKVYFVIRGTSSGGSTKHHAGYMKAGNANCYIHGTTTNAPDTLTVAISGPGGLNHTQGWWAVPASPYLNVTSYVRPPNEIKANGVQDWKMTGTHNVSYVMTVIQ